MLLVYFSFINCVISSTVFIAGAAVTVRERRSVRFELSLMTAVILQNDVQFQIDLSIILML